MLILFDAILAGLKLIQKVTASITQSGPFSGLQCHQVGIIAVVEADCGNRVSLCKLAPKNLFVRLGLS